MTAHAAVEEQINECERLYVSCTDLSQAVQDSCYGNSQNCETHNLSTNCVSTCESSQRACEKAAQAKPEIVSLIGLAQTSANAIKYACVLPGPINPDGDNVYTSRDFSKIGEVNQQTFNNSSLSEEQKERFMKVAEQREPATTKVRELYKNALQRHGQDSSEADRALGDYRVERQLQVYLAKQISPEEEDGTNDMVYAGDGHNDSDRSNQDEDDQSVNIDDVSSTRFPTANMSISQQMKLSPDEADVTIEKSHKSKLTDSELSNISGQSRVVKALESPELALPGPTENTQQSESATHGHAFQASVNKVSEAGDIGRVAKVKNKKAFRVNAPTTKDKPQYLRAKKSFFPFASDNSSDIPPQVSRAHSFLKERHGKVSDREKRRLLALMAKRTNKRFPARYPHSLVKAMIARGEIGFGPHSILDSSRSLKTIYFAPKDFSGNVLIEKICESSCKEPLRNMYSDI